MAVVNGVKSDWFGVNLDTGNFISSTPYKDLARCAPRAVNVQLKSEIKRPEKGIEQVDLDKIGRLLTEADYRGFVVVEFEGDNPQVNVPKFLAKVRASWKV